MRDEGISAAKNRKKKRFQQFGSTMSIDWWFGGAAVGDKEPVFVSHLIFDYIGHAIQIPIQHTFLLFKRLDLTHVQSDIVNYHR